MGIASRDVNFYSNFGFSVSAAEASFLSFDNTIAKLKDLFIATDELTFQNSVGSGGDVNFITESFDDTITFRGSNGVTWNMGENVIGYSAERTSFVATAGT